MEIKLLTMAEKAHEMGITYRWILDRTKNNKIPYVTRKKKKYFLPKLTTMQLLEFAMDHQHIGKPCVCSLFINEIISRMNKESEIL